MFTLEEQYNDKVKELREGFANEKKIMMMDCDQKLKEVKSKVNEG